MYYAKSPIKVFPNNNKGWGYTNTPQWVGIENFAGGGGVYRVVRIKAGVILLIQNLFKAKKAFCEYWTSVKMKIV